MSYLIYILVIRCQTVISHLFCFGDGIIQIIGNGTIDDGRWDEITWHARSYVVHDGKVYTYSGAHATIYVNCVFDLVKVEFGDVECQLQQLDEADKVSPSSNCHGQIIERKKKSPIFVVSSMGTVSKFFHSKS